MVRLGKDESYTLCQSTVVLWLAPFVRSSIPISRLCHAERHRSWCWRIIVKHIFTRSIRPTPANWTRMSVMTAESTRVWVWHSTAHYLPGQPTLNSRVPSVSRYVATRHPCPCGHWTTTGGCDWSAQPASVGRLAVWPTPWLHSAASPLLYVCGGYF